MLVVGCGCSFWRTGTNATGQMPPRELFSSTPLSPDQVLYFDFSLVSVSPISNLEPQLANESTPIFDYNRLSCSCLEPPANVKVKWLEPFFVATSTQSEPNSPPSEYTARLLASKKLEEPLSVEIYGSHSPWEIATLNKQQSCFLLTTNTNLSSLNTPTLRFPGTTATPSQE